VHYAQECHSKPLAGKHASSLPLLSCPLLPPNMRAYVGERGHSQDSNAAQQQLLHFFDRDQSGTIDFNEFVLIVICLSVPEKDIEVVFDVMDLVRISQMHSTIVITLLLAVSCCR
jgi:hypothetical protein